MRRLLLIRHGKSSWDHPSLYDHDRPLNKRGKRDIVTMSQRLAQREPQLQAVISSTAVRAETLAREISQQLSCPIYTDRRLYTFDERQLLATLCNLPDSNQQNNYQHNTYQQIAIVGHNPAITAVANRLTGAAIDNIPTSGIVAIDCPIAHWHNLADQQHRIDYFDSPKNIAPNI